MVVAHIGLIPLFPYHDSWLQLLCWCPAHPTSKSPFTIYQLLPNFSLLLLLPLNPQWRLGVSHLPSAAAKQSSFTSLICCITDICPSERLCSLFLLLLFLLLKPLVLVLYLPMKTNVCSLAQVRGSLGQGHEVYEEAGWVSEFPSLLSELISTVVKCKAGAPSWRSDK